MMSGELGLKAREREYYRGVRWSRANSVRYRYREVLFLYWHRPPGVKSIEITVIAHSDVQAP